MSERAPSVSPRALEGVRVLDLSRILAGPSAAQLLGDLGADVIKVERPGRGDDTRGWGPPYLPMASADEVPDAAYFLCANRNKRSLAVDLAHPEGQALVRALALRSDVLVENYKTGDLARRGLGPEALLEAHPGLVYCSISGFGRTGPRAAEPGYDYLAQAMGGLMSLTGEPSGAPQKVGVGVADLFCGMYAVVGILAALRHRDRTGEGQHLDLALFDTQLAWLANAALDHFVTGSVPRRMGNAHPHIVPYETFATADGHVVLAIGNDAQFQRFMALVGLPERALDARFATNGARVEHRALLVPELAAVMRTRTTAAWLGELRRISVPASPVHDVAEAFAEPQAQARGMRLEVPMPRARDGVVPLVANPIRASRTPPRVDRPPPGVGEHGREVLREVLGLDDAAVDALATSGAIALPR